TSLPVYSAASGNRAPIEGDAGRRLGSREAMSFSQGLHQSNGPVAAHYVYSGWRVYAGLGDSFLLGRCWLPSGGCNALAGGTEVLLVSRLAGTIWGLWIAGFAKRFTRSSGMALSSTRACALTWLGSSPPEGRMRRCSKRCNSRMRPAADRNLGNSVGAIESVARGLGVSHTLDACGWGSLRLLPFLPVHHGLLRGVRSLASAVGLTIVTWLILPVVICLSQRLSHACLSISNYTVKLRMAH
ncbi:hypothetical protein CMV_025915, partial [Castanea mollissima]